MKTRNTLIALALTGILAVSMTACGSSDAAAASSAQAESAASEAEETESTVSESAAEETESTVPNRPQKRMTQNLREKQRFIQSEYAIT